MEVVASLSQGRTAAGQCGLFTHKSVPVIFEPPCITSTVYSGQPVSFTGVHLTEGLKKINLYKSMKVELSGLFVYQHTPQ